MRYYSQIFFVIVSLLLSVNPACAWSGRVVGVVAGDTINVMRERRGLVSVSLYGIKAPQSDQAFGREAQQFTAALLSGKVVKVQEIGKDNQGQIISLVRLEDTLMNQELVKVGLAWVHDDRCKQRSCGEWRDLEYEARQSGAGLWRDPEPVPPWEWRKSRR